MLKIHFSGELVGLSLFVSFVGDTGITGMQEELYIYRYRSSWWCA